jgi:hypothetical protein
LVEGSLEQRYPPARLGRPNWTTQKPTDKALGVTCLEEERRLGLRQEDAESLEAALARINVIRRSENEIGLVRILA